MHDREGISLAKALRVERGSVVSFVGGGGKTTSMFRLAAELCAAGLRVVTTTTTHISKEQVHLAPASVSLDALDSLAARLDEHGHCLIIGAPDGKGRVFGASSQLIAALRDRPDIDVILIEADGSRSLPFKAPGKHEPVVPEITTILVPIAGLNSLGAPLDENHVHRSEIAAALAQAPLGSPITAETIARVLSHPEGGAKQLPAGAKLAPLLNKADTDAAVQQGGELAEKLLASPVVDTVAVSCMLREPPVVEAWTPVAGIVLAAGRAIRFGNAKQVLPWQDMTLVAHSARVALKAGLDPVIVVAGHEAEKVEKALAGLPVQLVFNSEFALGQSASLRRGIEALPQRTGAALMLLADQPLITAEMLRTIIRAHRRTFAPICVPVFEGLRGNPALFGRDLFRELGELQGDIGGRALFEKYSDAIAAVPASRAVLADIDTPEDYERLNGAAPITN
jgi:molybdenum cofactor cytidylyltransferase